MDWIIKWGGTALEVLLFWRLVSWRAWRHYPAFFVFYAYLFARWILILNLERVIAPSSVAFSYWFWYTVLGAVLLQFPVAWEVFQKLFGDNKLLRNVSGSLLVVVLTVLAAFYYGEGRPTILVTDLYLYLALVVACWVVGLLVVSLYYQTALGRNLWGIAIGLGLHASIAVMNYAALALNRAAFVIVFGYVRSSTFVLALLIWTWALWFYSPKPPVGSLPPSGPYDAGKPLETSQTIRRALGL